MKSYNQFMCEVYDLQESGQIDLAENPFQGALTNFSQSRAGKALNKGYRAVTTNPIVNNRFTRGGVGLLNRAATPLFAADNYIRRKKYEGQSDLRAIPSAIAQTYATAKGATIGGAKGAAACALGGPAASAVCGTVGAGIGGYLGYKGSGLIDKFVDASKKPPKMPERSASSMMSGMDTKRQKNLVKNK